ncbi:uncharacterized protein J7T54_007053 [Emericellopsis cladophorae]|uniref:Uncharacterized protein n=1 Tax=Emericellopsis cladophorae TaxID=2686198 RepID=A0A9P9Y8H0_9HYPO|nr:uncharacterized protein J7T54_007053 [Emericellopsis cladophorae]KAI6785411.1 hypothetical protein J7T54_007053 [Emericellopsis cladophorae]
MSSQSAQGGSAGGQPAEAPSGPPYVSQFAQHGGIPTVKVDVPICAVFLACFLAGAILNMTIWKRNGRRGHKFLLSAVVFYFCFARMVACILRIVWATRPDNVRISIAAGILFNAGVLILFVINLIFLQRLTRAYHPNFGWSKTLNWTFYFLYFGIFACFVMVVYAVVSSCFTLDRSMLSNFADIRRTSAIYMAFLSTIPLPATLLLLVWPRKRAVDKFGQGSMTAKVVILLITTSLLATGSIFRASIGFMPRPKEDPGWFNHRVAYYLFNYFIELVVVYILALNRMDKRFHVPDGAKLPGDYSKGATTADRNAVDDEAVLNEEKPTTPGEERSRENEWEMSLQREMEYK